MSIRSSPARLALISAGVAGSLLAVSYGLRQYVRHSLPKTEGEERLAGLEQPVEIIRDRWGVPHIYANTTADLLFAQGFVHAQDRLFQMDVNRRLGAGRLSEVVGSLGLPTDRLARIMGWPRASQAVITGIAGDSETSALLNAYAAGVNAFIDLGKLPPAFRALAYRPEPWQPLDSAAWGTVLAWGLSSNWETELVRARLVAILGPEKAADLTPGYDADYPTVLPVDEMNGRVARELHEAYRVAARELPFGGARPGSNNWVVNGNWTESGRPILANDPHLPPLFPAIWYENHLQGGDLHVTGFTTPGVPGVVIGHNEQIAWGVTNAFPDIQDLYLEEFDTHDPTRYRAGDGWRQAEIVREEIQVRGRRRPVVEEVRYTHHGPIITALAPEAPGEIALRWSAHETNNHFRALFGINRATNWASFHDALRDWAFPPQNIVYADVTGNIGYMMPGKVPLRREGAGLTPVNGAGEDGEWRGWLPFTELPQAFNPTTGMIVTANNRVTDDVYPHLLTGEWLPPYRAERITALLMAGAPLTLQSCGAIQNDVVSLMARRFLAAALPALQPMSPGGDLIREQALILLRQWHTPAAGEGNQMDAQLVAPALFFAWLSSFARAAMTQAIGVDLTNELLSPAANAELPAGPFHEISLELTVTWLEGNPPEWVGDIRPLLSPAFAQALQLLQQHLGANLSDWRWGRLHRIGFEHLLTRFPGIGRLWRPRYMPAAGDGFTVNQAESIAQFPPEQVKIIASCRLLMDVGDWDNSQSALAGGQSGHPASAHYQDGLAAWRNGRYHPMLFSRSRVMDGAVHYLQLEPG